MKWKRTPITKIYEALGAVVDNRVEASGNTGKVYSSTRNKFYNINYDPAKKQIMSNDNASYFKGYLGYPAIAYLMFIKVLPYDESIASILKGIAWKDINQKFKNNFEKALEFILSTKNKGQVEELNNFVKIIDAEISKLKLGLLGEKTLPPEGY